MKRSIRDYQEKPETQQPSQDSSGYAEMLGQLNPNALGSMQNAVEHYSGKNDNELLQELRQYRAAGAFDDKALQEVATRLAPMLMVNKEAQQNRTRTVSPAAIPSKANYRVKSKKHL